mgnify:FL=1|jgi:hypothetical protein
MSYLQLSLFTIAVEIKGQFGVLSHEISRSPWMVANASSVVSSLWVHVEQVPHKVFSSTGNVFPVIFGKVDLSTKNFLAKFRVRTFKGRSST